MSENPFPLFRGGSVKSDSNLKVHASLRSALRVKIIDFSPLWLQTPHCGVCLTRRAHPSNSIELRRFKRVFFCTNSTEILDYPNHTKKDLELANTLTLFSFFMISLYNKIKENSNFHFPILGSEEVFCELFCFRDTLPIISFGMAEYLTAEQPQALAGRYYFPERYKRNIN